MSEINKKMPLVSVCIPVYNNSDFIKETMKSVLSSTYANIELIIVDDNSKDGSLNVIFEAARDFVRDGLSINYYDFSGKDKEYKRTLEEDEDLNIPKGENDSAKALSLNSHAICIFHNTENLGMSGNWNRCLELCRGKYIKLICADDLIDENLISREVEVLENHPEVLSVESDTEFRDSEGKSQGFYKRYKKSGVVDGKEIVRYSLFHRDYLGAPLANMFRKESYDKYGGFDSDFSYIIDYEFFMRLAVNGKVFIIHEPLNFFRIRDDSNTGEVLKGDKGEAYVKEHEKLVKKYQDILSLSDSDVKRSVMIRKIMNVLGRLYLKVHL